jgi:FtsZ-interacting cell division protein ZipA
MLLDIHQISLKLGGRILDEDRNNLNNQMMNHIRDRIVKYSLKP